MKLVNNSEGEWEFLLKKKVNETKLIKPTEFNAISAKGDILLDAFQPTPILLKFLPLHSLDDTLLKNEDNKIRVTIANK